MVASDAPKPGDMSDKKIAGGSLIPILLDLVTHVLAKLNYKMCFWSLFGLALFPWEFGFFATLRGFGRSFLVLLAGFFCHRGQLQEEALSFP